MTEILLYAEDPLLEALGQRIAAHVGLGVRASKITAGRGNLEKRLPQLNRAAVHLPILALLDRDRRGPCPGAEVERLIPSRQPGLLLRFAVEEADAWLLADREGVARFFGIAASKVPGQPEDLPDPKQVLVNLARRARSREKQAIAPRPGTTPKIGPAYNVLLCGFVLRQWSIDRVVETKSAPSLERCIAALNRTVG